VINRLMEFLLSQRRRLNGWELPLAGLLLITGAATAVATLQAAAPHKQAKDVVDSTSNAPNLETAAPHLPSPALDSSSLASNLATAEHQKAVAPQKQAPAVDSTSVASNWEATTPQQQAPAVDSTSVASNWEATAPQEPEPAVDSPAVPSHLPTATPHKQAKATASTAVASNLKAATPHKQAKATASTAVASNLKAATPHKQAKATASTAVASNLKAATPHKQAKATASTAVASNLKAATPHKQAKATASTTVTMPSAKWNRQAQGVDKATIAQVRTSVASLPDGTYLYGQSSEPQQIGKEYLVFQVSQGKVRGAMYLPSSEYSCFYGTLESKEMNLTVVNSYDQTGFSQAIARSQPSQIAAAGGQINLQNSYDSITYPHTVKLEGYQPVSQISDNDKQLLNSCQKNPQGQGD
jgi:hypothetical protein